MTRHGSPDDAPEAAPADHGSTSSGAVPGSSDADLIASARRRHGTLGAVVAGGMLGLEKVLGRPAKEEIPAVWEADGEPLDIDRSGITVPIDEHSDASSRPPAPGARRVVKRRR